MTRCLTPTIIQPDSNNIPLSEWVDFSRAMSIGILSTPEINILSLKIHHHAYVQHMESKQLWENFLQDNVGPGSDMRFTLDSLQLSVIKEAITTQIIPFFQIFGESYVVIFGFFLCMMTLSYCLGTCHRLFAEYRIAGCGPWLLLALLGNIWNIWRLPLSMLKGAAKAARSHGAHGSSSEADNVTISARLRQLNTRIHHVEACKGAPAPSSPQYDSCRNSDNSNTDNPSTETARLVNPNDVTHQRAVPTQKPGIIKWDSQ